MKQKVAPTRTSEVKFKSELTPTGRYMELISSDRYMHFLNKRAKLTATRIAHNSVEERFIRIKNKKRLYDRKAFYVQYMGANIGKERANDKTLRKFCLLINKMATNNVFVPDSLGPGNLGGMIQIFSHGDWYLLFYPLCNGNRSIAVKPPYPFFHYEGEIPTYKL